ncbi:MAG: VCBS repeat-containing protein, partial [Acidobacteria bacterium]|nr:VCBS repeat-containing protein [Acidobacteriota bacterium]
DYDGDGKNDHAVFRPGTATWWIFNSSNGSVVEQQFGASTDQLAPADYDGDGKTNIAVFRPSTGYWYTSLDVNTNFGATLWGQNGDIAIETSNVP